MGKGEKPVSGNQGDSVRIRKSGKGGYELDGFCADGSSRVGVRNLGRQGRTE